MKTRESVKYLESVVRLRVLHHDRVQGELRYRRSPVSDLIGIIRKTYAEHEQPHTSSGSASSERGMGVPVWMGT